MYTVHTENKTNGYGKLRFVFCKWKTENWSLFSANEKRKTEVCFLQMENGKRKFVFCKRKTEYRSLFFPLSADCFDFGILFSGAGVPCCSSITPLFFRHIIFKNHMLWQRLRKVRDHCTSVSLGLFNMSVGLSCIHFWWYCPFKNFKGPLKIKGDLKNIFLSSLTSPHKGRLKGQSHQIFRLLFWLG